MLVGRFLSVKKKLKVWQYKKYGSIKRRLGLDLKTFKI